jgi:serine/threonine protein kinase
VSEGTYDPTLKRPSDAPPAVELPEGMEVGEYRVQRKIGEGGMGAVYAAVHPVIGKRVAIKVLAPHIAGHPELVRRFIDEARSVNKIGHPNIVDIFSFGWLPDQRHYFVMEYLEGQSLTDRMKSGSIDRAEARRLLGHICGALEAAHQAGIVHRDLKPDNIWIAQPKHGDSFAKLLDFGIAKLMGEGETAARTVTGTIMGTPAYMAPEQCRGVGVDSRSDLYAVGVILYEMFCGRTPFQGSFVELITQHLTIVPEAPSRHRPVPPALERVIMACLEKDPSRRPPSAAALGGAIAAALGDAAAAAAAGAPAAAVAATPRGAAPDTLAPLPGKTHPGATLVPARVKRPWLWIAAASVAAAALVALSVRSRPHVATTRPPATSSSSSSSSSSGASAPVAPGSGHIRVVAQNASSARFFIDGRLAASGGREADLPSVEADRPHILRVEADGMTPSERRFTVAAGGLVEIQIVLASSGAPAATASKPVVPASAAPVRAPAVPHARAADQPPRPAPAAKSTRHRDGLVGDDIFDAPGKR